MKLSEAIRIGAAKRPQAFDAFATVDESGQVSTCALGAAYEALTGHPPSTTLTKLGEGALECYLADRLDISVGVIRTVIILNDGQRLSREQIAAGLEAQGL